MSHPAPGRAVGTPGLAPSVREAPPAVTLAGRAKAALKVALAMALAYGIAAALGWPQPYWASLAIAMCSLTSLGETVGQGLLRILGTLVGVAVTLLLIALFPRQPWLFLLALSLFLAWCTYRMAGDSRWYVWFVAGVTVPILGMASGPAGTGAFSVAILRGQEILLGVTAYSLVAMLLWPKRARSDLEAAVRALAADHHALFRHRARRLFPDDHCGDGAAPGPKATAEASAVDARRRRATRTLEALDRTLDAAELDSLAVWRARHTWRRAVARQGELHEALERWRAAAVDVEGLDPARLMPELPAWVETVDRRLAAMAQGLAAAPVPPAPGPGPALGPAGAGDPGLGLDLGIEGARLDRLGPFDRAAVLLLRDRLREVERLSRTLPGSLAAIRDGVPSSAAAQPTGRPGRRLPVPDRDRLAGAGRQIVVLWLALLAWILVPGLPVPAAFIAISNTLAMALAVVPQLPVTRLLAPSALAVLLGGALHLVVTPQVSGFTSLAILIFEATFLIGFLFADARHMIGRILGLSLFAVLAGLEDERAATLAGVATVSLVFPLVLGLVSLTLHVPRSTRPEAVLRRQLGRFLHSGAALMGTLGRPPGRAPTRLERWRTAYCRHEIATLPRTMAPWAEAADPAAAPGGPTGRPQALIDRLQILGYRLRDLLEAWAWPPAPAPLAPPLPGMRAWRLAVEDGLRRLAEHPDAVPGEALEARLAGILARLEHRTRRTLDRAGGTGTDRSRVEQVQRLLGAQRGVAEALVACARTANEMEWGRRRDVRS